MYCVWYHVNKRPIIKLYHAFRRRTFRWPLFATMWDDLESPKELDIVSDNKRMRKYTGDRIFKCIKPVKGGCEIWIAVEENQPASIAKLY